MYIYMNQKLCEMFECINVVKFLVWYASEWGFWFDVELHKVGTIKR